MEIRYGRRGICEQFLERLINTANMLSNVYEQGPTITGFTTSSSTSQNQSYDFKHGLFLTANSYGNSNAIVHVNFKSDYGKTLSY